MVCYDYSVKTALAESFCGRKGLVPPSRVSLAGNFRGYAVTSYQCLCIYYSNFSFCIYVVFDSVEHHWIGISSSHSIIGLLLEDGCFHYGNFSFCINVVFDSLEHDWIGISSSHCIINHCWKISFKCS